MSTAKTHVGDSPIHGRGLFASAPIRRGDYIGTFKGPDTDTDGAYVLWLTDEDGNHYGRRGMNALRYLNHSDDPNAEFDNYDLYATRDIEPGEEITIDYGW